MASEPKKRTLLILAACRKMARLKQQAFVFIGGPAKIF
jgi:hypothetical protein